MRLEKAIKQEEKIRIKYIENGFESINIAKTGGSGNSGKYWTKERVIEEAKKYSSRMEFKKNSSTAYGNSHKFGISQEACAHMGTSRVGLTKSIEVDQFSLKGNLIRRWSSFSEARRGGFPESYYSAVTGKIINGFIWKYVK